MATDGRISSMIRDLEPDETNIFETSKPSGGSTSGYITRAVSLNGIANAVLNEMEYTTDLETEAKQVIPAVNELYTKGGKNSVLFIPQELTEAQKVQARQNIGASGGSDVTMQDNTKGGVDLNVGGVTRTLINKSDITMVDNTAGGVDLNIFNTSNTLVKQSDFEDLKAEVNNKTLRFVDQNEEGMSYPPEGAIIESLLTVDGKSEQKSFKGYNILPTVQAGTLTEKGITLVSDGEGGFTASGTSTEAGNLLFLLNKPFTIPKAVSGGGGGVAYLFNTKARSSGMSVRFRKGSTDLNSWALSSVNRVTSVWSGGVGETADRIGLYFGAGVNVDGLSFRPMFVVDGIEDHEFEQYVGGTSSPNPEYPQEIVSAHQLRFTKTGKNLYRAKSAGLESNIFNAGNLIPVRTGQRVFVNIDYTYTGTRDIFFRIFDDKGAIDKNEAIPNSTEWIRASDEVYEFVAKFDGFIGLCANSDISTYTINRCIVSKVPIVAGEFPEYHEELKTIIPPFTLNKFGEFADCVDIQRGEWVKRVEDITISKDDWTEYGKDANSIYARYNQDTPNYYNRNEICVISDKLTGVAYVDRHENIQIARIYFSGASRLWCGLDPNANINSLSELVDYIGISRVVYPSLQENTAPIETEDLFYLRSLQNLPADTILTITDENGRDLSYLMKYLIQRGATTP